MADKFDILNDSVKELKDKVESIDETLKSVDRTLIVNTESLKEHIRRTEINEIALERLKEELLPVQKHVIQVNTIMKAAGVIFTLIAAAYYLVSIFKTIN